MRKTSIINLYGGPGTGKSTSAAFLYYLMKEGGLNVELVREYVKDWVWEKRVISNYDQFYLLGKQIRRESMLYDKVDYIVTDSPIFQGLYYANAYSPEHVKIGVQAATYAFYKQAQADGHRHYHVFLQRSKPYNPSGRYQTLEEAVEIDRGIKEMLEKYGMQHIDCSTDQEQLRGLLSAIRSETGV
jgi:2-phosphoglycerate kinase